VFGTSLGTVQYEDYKKKFSESDENEPTCPERDNVAKNLT
jgi:hypothetical protein